MPLLKILKIRCDMRGKLFNYLLLVFIVLLTLSALGYYLIIAKFYDMAEKLILDTDITSEFEMLEERHQKQKYRSCPEKLGCTAWETPWAANKTNSSSTQKKAEPQESIPDRLNQAVTFEDKRRILHLVAKKLTADDIKYLTNLLKGGLTPEEKKLAVELARKRFGPDEIKEIRSLYHKYKEYAY